MTKPADATVARPAVPLSQDAENPRLTREQKLAGLLLMLSPENATQVLKQLDENELSAVSTEMAQLHTLNEDLQRQILHEFSPVAVEAATAVCGGVEKAQSLLEKSVGMFRASDLLGRVSTPRPSVEPMRQIMEMDARHIFNLVQHEKIQTIALVLSYLGPEKASQVLNLCPTDMRVKVVERLATMRPASLAVVENVAQVLQRKFGNIGTRANQTGGPKAAAQVLNALPKNVSKSILATLKEQSPELEENVRKNMFTFEEFQRLDARTLQRILQEIDLQLLTISLKTAGDDLKDALLACISKRAAQNVREEIDFMGPVKLSEIEAARSKIIETARKLEADGEVDLEYARQKKS